MSPGNFLADSSNAARPHRSDPANEPLIAEASTHTTSTSLEDYGDDALLSYPTREEEEEEGHADHLEEPSDHSGDEELRYDDDDDDNHRHHHFHHHHHHHHHQQPPHHVLLPHPAQLASFYNLDGYISDDLDMSDDAHVGGSLVNYLQVANLLTSDMDVDVSVDSSGEFDFNGAMSPDGAAHGDHQNAVASDPSLLLSDTHLSSPSPPPLDTVGFADMPSHFQPLPPPPLLNPSAVSSQLEQLVAEIDDPAVTAWFEDPHPVALTNPNPNTLGPGNYNLVDFLHHWARQSRGLSGLPRERGRYPWAGKITELSSKLLAHVQYADLEGDQCDLQGIDWESLGVTRREARERRLLTYNNYVNKQGSDRWTPNLPDVSLPRTESYFRFRRMDIRRNVSLSHFQLRNVLAGTSRTRVFYPGVGVVHEFNPVSSEARVAAKLSDAPASQVSTLAAEHGVMIAGCFNGEYILRHLDSDEPETTASHDGIITSNINGITNHIQIHKGRGSSAPLAAFASNDMHFRVLDVATETWLSRERFLFPLNCTALSPDRRLRVMVGDDFNVLIAAAESTLSGGRPEILQALSGHRDFGFACDWADDGWTVATGFQDKSIKIWDARWWTDSSGFPSPVCTLRAEMAGVRGLRFSPVGSGKRVLVAAEEADFVNIIDAQTFRSKQTLDIFGEIGGITFGNDGRDLTVLCCDQARGGLLQLERCGVGQETTWNLDDTARSSRDYRRRRGTEFDWRRSQFIEEKRVKETASRRRRKGALSDAVEPF